MLKNGSSGFKTGISQNWKPWGLSGITVLYCKLNKRTVTSTYHSCDIVKDERTNLKFMVGLHDELWGILTAFVACC